MLVTLVGKNSKYKTVLPQIAIGNYWISDTSKENEKKLINIQAQNGKWQIVSTNYARIINTKHIKIQNGSIQISKIQDSIIDKVNLNEYSMYCIEIGNLNELYILYCSPVYEKNFCWLNIRNTSEILIGNNINNNIIYKNALLEGNHARIFLNNGRWMIENFDRKFGTFVNDVPVLERKILFNGDVIFIMGLKIIIMGNNILLNNPQNKVSYDSQIFQVIKHNLDIPNIEPEEDNEIQLYDEDEYFSRAPRITNLIECEKIRIDPPPQVQSNEEMPAILMFGSMLSMGVMSMVSMVSSFDRLMSGTASTKQIVFTLITTVAMLASMILFPILNQKYQKRQKIKYEEKRQKRYKEYINSKIKVIDEIMTKQRNILVENYVPAEECVKIILEKGMRLWERKIEDPDFLSVRLGIGDVPLNINIQYPEESFTMEDDNLVEILNTIGNKSKILKDAPIAISLVEKSVSALIVKDKEKIEKFMQSLILQLITFHSYEDLKLVFLVKEDKKWDYVKMLPHIWDDTKQIRFFADNYEDMKEVARYLEEELKNRLQHQGNNTSYESFMPYYLIITDDYRKIENIKSISEILKTKTNLGFSFLCITNNLMQLPNECKTFIDIDEKVGTIFESEISSTNKKQFIFDDSQTFFFDKIIHTISNIPIKYTATGGMLLPNNYTFLEMYDVGCIEQLNILQRWKNNDATLSLKAPIGIDTSGMPIVLDIHEKFHGPHGLIAGSTGSGKSEFIITYILSLAINYHPDDLAFVLIDYKGGGLAGAFKKRDIKLPHLVGTITNIDTVGLQRSLDSIQSELRRRQIIFNKARDMTNEGTIDIYKYQKLYHSGVVNTPIPHLLIICDEFAELKQQQQDFMDELISVARIGRSLGVHLILATQKPAGIVNEQIRSNSKFGICLKVQDKADSNDVIKRPDAANLKSAGQFYLQVGNDEYFVLGQSAWSGAPYFPSNVTKKKIDTSIEFVSNTGVVIKKVDDTVKKVVNSSGEQLTNIVEYVYELAKQNNIKAEPLWLENIPETIYLNEVKEKYDVKSIKNNIDPVIGEYDDPYNQNQGIVSLKLSKEGNTIIFGNAESGKETLLSTMVYDIITTYNSDEAQLYLLDFGSEALKIFKGAPHIGDIIFANDTEKISRFFDMLQKEIRNRKATLSDYNGDYNLYLNTSGKAMPMIVVVINNYEIFAENYGDKYEDTFQVLTREGIKSGIVFVITTSSHNNLRYRLAQNFKQKIALQLNNQDDYLNIFEKLGKKRPSPIFGRGLVTLGTPNVYEFQTAKICKPEDWNIHIKEIITKLKETNNTVAKHIPVIPERVTIEDVQEEIKDLKAIPLGIAKKTLNIFTWDFVKNLINIITYKNMEDTLQFITYLIQEFEMIKNVNITVFDAERIIQTKKVNINKEFKEFSEQMEQNTENNDIKQLCIIIGLDKFLNDLDDDKNAFSKALQKAEDAGIYNFIFIENATRLKNHQYDDWYKKYILGDTGIWLGNGIEDQYLLNVNSRREVSNNCGISFGYAVKQGQTTLIKLLGVKEKGDDNE